MPAWGHLFVELEPLLPVLICFQGVGIPHHHPGEIRVGKMRQVKRADSKMRKGRKKILTCWAVSSPKKSTEGANFRYLRCLSLICGWITWTISKGHTCQNYGLDQVTYHAARVWASHSIDASRLKSQHCRSCSSHVGLGWQMLSWSILILLYCSHTACKMTFASSASNQKQKSFTAQNRFWDVPITSHCWEDDKILLTALKLIHGGNP